MPQILLAIMFVMASNVLFVENNKKFSSAKAEKEVNAPKIPTKRNSFVACERSNLVETANRIPASKEPTTFTTKVLQGKELIVSLGINIFTE